LESVFSLLIYQIDDFGNNPNMSFTSTNPMSNNNSSSTAFSHHHSDSDGDEEDDMEPVKV